MNEETGAGIADMVWRGLPLRGREFGTGDILFNDGAGYFRDGSFGAPTDTFHGTSTQTPGSRSPCR